MHVEAPVPCNSILNSNISMTRGYAYFLKGPIALSWLASASNISGKAMNVAVLLAFLHGLNKGNKFKVEKKFRDYFGIHRSAFYSGLENLEKAKLITLEKSAGQTPWVQILFPKSLL